MTGFEAVERIAVALVLFDGVAADAGGPAGGDPVEIEFEQKVASAFVDQDILQHAAVGADAEKLVAVVVVVETDSFLSSFSPCLQFDIGEVLDMCNEL